ncbi:MAG: hypothetical protein KH307_09635 [Varibaculum cambriense]|uniref:hypothetical protein n=1 Tax=Varibaculum cambriense TaxID=184870 RepID=UPI0024204929|nr:hypothetical protein [Varibaculum cambriense]MBS6620532.1 hypothetical protein [Varibaculum cambriense]
MILWLVLSVSAVLLFAAVAATLVLAIQDRFEQYGEVRPGFSGSSSRRALIRVWMFRM